MTNIEYWKNFNLGTELDISGSFIFNGLKAFDEMESFYHNDCIFEFLYQISIGIERLIKISIILQEYNDSNDEESFIKKIKHHHHGKLIQRIIQNNNLKLQKEHNNFLDILDNFYNEKRYIRYELEHSKFYENEKNLLIDFIHKYTSIKIDNSNPIFVTPNTKLTKKFIGNIVKKIVTELYDIIYHESKRLNIYTYEIRYASKAYKIFIEKEFDFINESLYIKELLTYIIHNKDNSDLIHFIKENINPLELDSSQIPYYINTFHKHLNLIDIKEEIESLYEDNKKLKDRLLTLEIIDNNSIDFSEINET